MGPGCVKTQAGSEIIEQSSTRRTWSMPGSGFGGIRRPTQSLLRPCGKKSSHEIAFSHSLGRKRPKGDVGYRIVFSTSRPSREESDQKGSHFVGKLCRTFKR